jgi:hypothetical protein
MIVLCIREKWGAWVKQLGILLIMDITFYLILGVLLAAFKSVGREDELINETVANFISMIIISVIVFLMYGIECIRVFLFYPDSVGFYFKSYGARTIIFVFLLVGMPFFKVPFGKAWGIVAFLICILDIFSYYIVDFVRYTNKSLKSELFLKMYGFWISVIALIFSVASFVTSLFK